ncbi:MAG TPA: transglycosylase domain-containing protein [Pseudonocardiaceae bacterium]|nr:transglycosylase domain-containing protein [Pseudonocardiaceae bacterium]
MNDRRDDQHRDEQRDGQPSWPTGSDPDSGGAAPGGDRPAGQRPTPAGPASEQPRAGGAPGGPAVPSGPGVPNGPISPARGTPQPPRGQHQPPGGPPPIRPGGQPTRAVGMPPPGGRPGMPPRGPNGPGGPQGRPGPGRPGERPTDHIPPVKRPDEYRREPDLLTHRDDDYLMDQQPVDDYDPAPSGYYEGDGKRGKRRKTWRWVRRTLYVLIFLGVTTPIAAFYLIYQNVTVPDPQTVAFGQAQPVTIYYADGTVMDKITTNSRIFIKPNTIPQNVRHAVEAAEDETFETNNGFDVKAIARTVFNQLTGGTGGGSTITQEYIKVATGNDQHSLSRKVSEVAEAYKMTKTYTNKNDILAAYLNIVYFGRGAYGIESAARAFYGVSAAQLTPPEAALLAGMIQAPGRANDAAYQQKRFTYVWGRMATNKWISQAEFTAGKFPTPKADVSAEQSLPWDRQLIVARVLAELQTNGWSQDALKAQGAQIYTTIQPTAQTQAEHSIVDTLKPDAKLMNGGGMVIPGIGKVTNNNKAPSAKNPQVKNSEAAALVSINPSNGEIVAWYGGNNPKASQLDMANTPHQPGSSFKPYVFTAGLEKDPQQIGLNSVWDPKSPQTILGHVVHNSDGDSCPDPCTVKKAMTNSINTVFYAMGAHTQVGTPAVQKAAFQAGIPKTEFDPTAHGQEPSLVTLDPNTHKPVQIEGGISIGQYPVRPLDQAQGYATFANNGMYIPAHFVRKVTDISGQNVLYQFNTPAKPAFSSDPQQSAAIARTVSDSMTDVAASSGYALADGRPADSKTGTQNYVAPDGTNNNYNSDAWTIGFTPQIVTAVWFGHYDNPGPIFGNGNNLLHVGKNTNYNVFGREEPGAIWQSYMNAYLKDQPIMQFPTSPADIGGSWNFVTNTDAAATPPASTPPAQPPATQTTPTTNPNQPPFSLPNPPGKHHPPTTTDPPTGTTVCDPITGCGGGGGGGGGPGNQPPAGAGG